MIWHVDIDLYHDERAVVAFSFDRMTVQRFCQEFPRPLDRQAAGLDCSRKAAGQRARCGLMRLRIRD